jgi:hypothetical protein
MNNENNLNGLYIVKDHLSDGTIRTSKIFLK